MVPAGRRRSRQRHRSLSERRSGADRRAVVAAGSIRRHQRAGPERILDDIDAGLPDGNRFSDAPKADERAAWRVIETHCPGKSEGPARQIVKTWLGSGLLVRKKYRNPVERKEINGLWVDNLRRPT